MNERATPPAGATPPAPAPKPAQPAAPAKLPVAGRDREFLPAALEILESPPPPLPVALMALIGLFAATALVWSFVGRLDVHAVASGKVETAGYSKVIEPLDPGRIAAIHVEAGQTVKAGDLLVELDPAEAAADAAAARDALDASLAEIARRRYAIESVRAAAEAEVAAANAAVAPAAPKVEAAVAAAPAPAASPTSVAGAVGAKAGAKAKAMVPTPTPTPTPTQAAPAPAETSIEGPSPVEALAGRPSYPVAWGENLPEAFRLREEAVLRADLTQLADALRALDRQMAQKQATKKRLDMSIAFQNTLMETLHQRVDTRQQAIDLNVGTKINLYDAKEQLEKAQSQLASDEGQRIETDAALSQVGSERMKAVSQFIADNENKLAEASRKRDESREGLAKARARLGHTKLYAPIDGVVRQTAVTTVGQVVTTGQELATITPAGGSLEIEALLPNLDIGFVKVGQPAVVKVDAFPFTRFGALTGHVVRIAPGAVSEPEAKRAMANATAAANASQSATPAGQPESFVFPITVALDDPAIMVDGVRVPLSPGMTVTVEIKTDSRRVIDYLLSPLAKIASEAAKER